MTYSSLRARINRQSDHRLMLGVACLSFLTTLLFWALLPPSFSRNESSDFTHYYAPVARNLLDGNGLKDSRGEPAIHYPPGYPFVLAGVYSLSRRIRMPDAVMLSAFILLCIALAALLVFLLARTAWEPLPALVAAALWATYPFSLWLTKQPNADVPFILAFYGTICVFWSALLHRTPPRVHFLLAGALAGASMLIRPIAIGTALLLGAILWVARRDLSVRTRTRLAGIILLGNFLVVLPWEIWVYAQTGDVVMLSTAAVPSIRDGLTFAVARKGRERISVPADVKRLQRALLKEYNELSTLGSIVSSLWAHVKSDPSAALNFLILKMARSWYATDSGRFERATAAIQIPYLLLFVWSSVTAWRRGGRGKMLAQAVWLITFYFWGMSILVLSILRYMVPAIGLMFLLTPSLFTGPNGTGKQPSRGRISGNTAFRG